MNPSPLRRPVSEPLFARRGSGGAHRMEWEGGRGANPMGGTGERRAAEGDRKESGREYVASKEGRSVVGLHRGAILSRGGS